MAKQIDLKIGPPNSTLRDPTPLTDVCVALNEVFILQSTTDKNILSVKLRVFCFE